jgi:hypothetical protein
MQGLGHDHRMIIFGRNTPLLPLVAHPVSTRSPIMMQVRLTFAPGIEDRAVKNQRTTATGQWACATTC